MILLLLYALILLLLYTLYIGRLEYVLALALHEPSNRLVVRVTIILQSSLINGRIFYFFLNRLVVRVTIILQSSLINGRIFLKFSNFSGGIFESAGQIFAPIHLFVLVSSFLLFSILSHYSYYYNPRYFFLFIFFVRRHFPVCGADICAHTFVSRVRP